MKTFLFITVFAFILISCEKEKVSPVITSFPITLVSDTTIIQQTEVFNKNGIMANYDEEYTKMKEGSVSFITDSLVISSPTNAQSFKKWIGMFYYEFYNVIIREDNFQTIPEKYMTTTIVDTRVEGNHYISTDKEVVRRSYTKTFKKIANEFVTDGYILRIYYMIPGGHPPEVNNMIMDVYGQLNIIDKKVLYQNLESNEVLVIFKYRTNFQIKSDI